MSVNNINNSVNIDQFSGIQPSQQNNTPDVNNNIAVDNSAPSQVPTRENTSLLGASLLKLQMQQTLGVPSTQIANISTPSTPAPNPSLQPRQVFKQPVLDFMQNTINLPSNRVKQGNVNLTVNSANVLQNSQAKLKGGGSATAFYTAGFPPTSTATLPRQAFDQKGVTSFYRSAQPLNATQLQSVQNLYAGDLTSRKNYAANLANLGRSLTTLRGSDNLSSNNRKQIDSALNTLKSAYTQLADPNAPAPSPRAVYAKVADVLNKLSNDCDLNKNQQAQINTGLNILAIGASNYDTNRVPVAGTPATPAPNPAPTPAQQTAAGFPLPSFDTVRNTPLSAAQSNPAQTFGANVSSYLQSIGLTNIDPNKVNYQVNSADVLQFITVPLGQGQTQTVFFNTGFPVPTNTAPQVAFNGTTGARQFLDVATPNAATQSRLQTYYANPANAARRTNYNTNLQNLTTAFQQLSSGGKLSNKAQQSVNDALSTLQAAQSQLAMGGLPDVLKTYQRISDDLDSITKNPGNLNSSQRDTLNTLNGSLLPVGVENYYLTPVSLSLTS